MERFDLRSKASLDRNQALITAKRVCLGDSHVNQAEQESAKKMLTGFLSDLKRGLATKPEDLPAPPLLKLVETVRNGRFPSGRSVDQAIDSCLTRT